MVLLEEIVVWLLVTVVGEVWIGLDVWLTSVAVPVIVVGLDDGACVVP